MKGFIYFVFFIQFIICSCTSPIKWGKEDNISDHVQLIPKNNILSDTAWNIWCASMVCGDDGKYHLYYSRWPRKVGHDAWITHSEIAYAVSDNPSGPYKHVNVALKSYSDSAWDGAMAHNPYIIHHSNKYYLYYIATSGSIFSDNDVLAPYSREWWRRRNTQRIGVAVADSPNGPWKRSSGPILSISEDTTAFDALCVTNPAVCRGRNGKFVMLYKAVCKNGTIQGGNVRFSVAFSESPEGPFIKTNKLIFQYNNSNERMIAEDPFIWYDKDEDKYFAIVRDVIRIFTGNESGGLALMESYDAINWNPSPYPKVLPSKLFFEDGSFYDTDKNGGIERPFLYIDTQNSKALLFGAFGIDNNGVKREHSFNAGIPIVLK